MRSVSGALVALAAAAALGAAADPGLRDHAIATSTAPLYLDGMWTARSGKPLRGAAAINISVPAWVPGDLLTDLQKAKVIPDPWLDITWIANSSLWTEHEWTFSTHFSVSGKDAALQLVFDGVKMGATVKVNGHTVGVVRDQFLRYTFTLGSAVGLLPGARANILEVTFAEDVAEDGRFMACTGGWVRLLTFRSFIAHFALTFSPTFGSHFAHIPLTFCSRFRTLLAHFPLTFCSLLARVWLRTGRRILTRAPAPRTPPLASHRRCPRAYGSLCI